MASTLALTPDEVRTLPFAGFGYCTNCGKQAYLRGRHHDAMKCRYCLEAHHGQERLF